MRFPRFPEWFRRFANNLRPIQTVLSLTAAGIALWASGPALAVAVLGMLTDVPPIWIVTAAAVTFSAAAAALAYVTHLPKLLSGGGHVGLFAGQGAAIADTAAEQAAVRPNSLAEAIRIEFQTSDPKCLRRTVFPAGNARFEVYVKIENRGDGFLTECDVRIVKIVPETEGSHTILPPSPFRLGRGEHQYLYVAGFNEEDQHTGQAVFNTLVAFAPCAPPYNSQATLPPPSLDAPAFITMEAKALECGRHSKQFKLWVGENRRLQMESVISSPAVQAARQRLWDLRASGVEIRNRAPELGKFREWVAEYQAWRTSVLDVAKIVSETLYRRLETLNQVRPLPFGLSIISKEHHQHAANLSEKLLRIEEFLEKDA